VPPWAMPMEEQGEARHIARYQHSSPLPPAVLIPVQGGIRVDTRGRWHRCYRYENPRRYWPVAASITTLTKWWTPEPGGRGPNGGKTTFGP